MGESVTEAVIASILKPTGSSVNEGDEIIELETEKVNQVLYAPAGGVVSWSVEEGDTVQIGDLIGSVDTEGTPTKEAPPAPEPEKEKVEDQPAPAPAPKPSGGRGSREMVPEFLEKVKKPAPKPTPPPQEPVLKTEEGRETSRKMSKIRKTIAKRLVDSLHNAAMLTTFNEVDMSAIMALRSKYKESFVEKHGVKLGFMSFFVKAVVEGLKTFPDLNSYIRGEEIVHREYYDIGIAVGTERGLVVPVVRGADELTFPEIEKEIVAFAKKAREGKLAISDLEGGGFTITNGGVYGSLLSTPILNPPQVGILGMHAIQKRPVVVGDEIVIRPMMYLAMSYDHRIVDGKEAVSFLVHLKEVLEDPSRLLFIDKG